MIKYYDDEWRAQGRIWLPFDYVYVVQVGEYYKVGYTQDMFQRLSQIRAGVPIEPYVRQLIITQHPAFVETILFNSLLEYHTHGEWFNASPVLVEELSGLVENEVSLMDMKKYVAKRLVISSNDPGEQKLFLMTALAWKVTFDEISGGYTVQDNRFSRQPERQRALSGIVSAIKYELNGYEPNGQDWDYA